MKYVDLVQTIDMASQELLGRAAAAVNQALVLRNWLVGAYVVEYEQSGNDRAKYGIRLLERLTDDLARRGLKGLGLSSIKNCRQFYLMYPQIRQSLTGEFWHVPEPVRIRQSPIGEFLTDATGSDSGFVSGNPKLRQVSKRVPQTRSDEFGVGSAPPPVVILVCSDRDRTEVEFATAGMDNHLFVSRYLTALPTAERLHRFLEADRARIEALNVGRPSELAPRPKKTAAWPARKE